MKENNEDAQRLDQILQWTGMSVNAFARKLGLEYRRELHRVKRGDIPLSNDLAHQIWCKFPQLSTDWLQTGNGPMVCNDMEVPYEQPQDKMVYMDVWCDNNNFHIYLNIRRDMDMDLFEKMTKAITQGIRSTLDKRR